MIKFIDLNLLLDFLSKGMFLAVLNTLKNMKSSISIFLTPCQIAVQILMKILRKLMTLIYRLIRNTILNEKLPKEQLC